MACKCSINWEFEGRWRPKPWKPKEPKTSLQGNLFWMAALGKAAWRMGHMMSSMSFLEMQVAIRGYSIVFIMVEVPE